MKTCAQLNLSELIYYLEEEPDKSLIVPVGFHKPHSYRGNYSEVAFEPKENVTVQSMLDAAKEALGSTYLGWKGGDYTMCRDSLCFLDYEGQGARAAISNVLLDYMTGKYK
jgi:hypothetical protein